MADEGKKRSVKDIKLAPTKGVRRPGAVSRAGDSSDGVSSRFKSAAHSEEPKRTEVPKQTQQKDSGVSFRRPTTASGEKHVPNKKLRKGNKLPKVFLLILFLIAVVFVSAFFSYNYLVEKANNPITLENIHLEDGKTFPFKIEKGASTSDIADALKEKDLINSTFIYKFLSKFNGYDGNYKAGTYTLAKGLSQEEIMVILTSNPESVKVTIPEGFTTAQIAARLEANKVCSAKDFLSAVETQDLTSYTFISKHDNRDHRLDGYLFPDTYEFEVNSSPDTIIYKMLNRYNEVYAPEFFTKAEEIGITQDQVMILASLVEKEAILENERPMIAGVFINRLRSKDLQKLQSCATIRYIYVKKLQQTLETVTVANTKIDDLYNTYLYKGLPPGPICNPGLRSIEAVLNYSHHDYYYFVARTDGSSGHIFSRTFDEHKAHNGF